MLDAIASHWSTLILILSLAMAAVGIVHAIMTKEDVRAATGWVGVMLLSPFLGAIIYAIASERIRISVDQ
ncbi:MAG: cardiolipin synthase, partial [Mesorhizobium sp.]